MIESNSYLVPDISLYDLWSQKQERYSIDLLLQAQDDIEGKANSEGGVSSSFSRRNKSCLRLGLQEWLLPKTATYLVSKCSPPV